jgi:Ycf66 protein N-terminus
MLNHLLAGVVGLGGLSLFLSGFFFPEVRRQPDFAWSGVALLYALVLWIEGDSTSGGALLGHIASVALILWFGWQTVQQRRQFAPSEDQTAIPGSLETLTPFLKEGWAQIMAAYGETSAWVQNQLEEEDSSTLPEMQTPPTPLQDASDEDWENSEASSTSLPAETPESSPTEPVVEEVIAAIATHQESATPPESALSEVPVETPPVAETLASASGDELDQAQEISEVPLTPTLIQTEPDAIQSSAAQSNDISALEEDDGSWPPKEIP